jgi:Ca2+-binding RTX toxin-like protein
VKRATLVAGTISLVDPGADVLRGGLGNDICFGGPGTDTLVGCDP